MSSSEKLKAHAEIGSRIRPTDTCKHSYTYLGIIGAEWYRLV